MGSGTFLQSIERNKYVDEKLRRELTAAEFDALEETRGIATVTMIPNWENKVRAFHHGGHG